MYKQELERYDGDLDAIAKDVIQYVVESVSDIVDIDGKPINVLFNLSLSDDDDVPPGDAYFRTIDEVMTQTRWLPTGDLVNAIVDQLKASLSHFAKIGDLVSLSVTAWKGSLQ